MFDGKKCTHSAALPIMRQRDDCNGWQDTPVHKVQEKIKCVRKHLLQAVQNRNKHCVNVPVLLGVGNDTQKHHADDWFVKRHSDKPHGPRKATSHNCGGGKQRRDEDTLWTRSYQKHDMATKFFFW